MIKQTSTALTAVGLNAGEASRGCCGGGQKSSRARWLMGGAAALVLIGLFTGSAVFGFAAIAPILYALPCLAMCGMCLFKHGEATAKPELKPHA